MWASISLNLVCHGPLTRYVKLRVAHVPGMRGTFSPPPWVSDPDMHHGTCVTHVPWCMPGSLTSDFLWSRWRGKCSRHSRRMRNPQFYVSGKTPMVIFADVADQVGVLELGGASTQITFLPSRPPRANLFLVRLGGVVYRLYAHSYLNYGQDRAYIQTTELISRNNLDEGIQSSSTVLHPCVLKGKWWFWYILNHNKMALRTLSSVFSLKNIFYFWNKFLCGL